MARKAVLDKQTNSAVETPKTLPEGRALVERAIEIVNHYPGRCTNSEGRPGGLIELPAAPRPIIIGDLHTNITNLEKILDHNSNRIDLESGKAIAIIVGDALHDDRTGHMKEMESSVLALDAILTLICKYPGRVYYIRGNHDTFDERLRKSGIQQGLELKKVLLSRRGPDYVAAVDRFFNALPVFIIAKHFVVTHAGPPHGGLTREELIDIHKYPEKLHQLLWIRVNEFHGNPSPKEYGEKDLRLCLELLNLPQDLPFIVGHNPLWNDGNKTGLWLNVIGFKNHHIIYSGSGSRAPYFTIQNDQLVYYFAIDKEPEVYYYG